MTDLTAAFTVSKPKKYGQKINTNRYIDDVADGDDGDDGTNFSGCGSNDERFAKQIFSRNVSNTLSIFHFEEDKKDIQSSTSHSFSDTPCAIFHQKSYDHTHPLSRNMPRTKSKTRYSEWKLYNLNAQYPILDSPRLIFWKWKKLKVRVDGWVVAEPTVVDGDGWDDHQQSQSDNLRWNGGWWGKGQALQCRAI